MAEYCPKCNFYNPYGAQICGECGYVLIVPEVAPHIPKEKRRGIVLPSGIEKVSNMGLTRFLTAILFLYGVALLAASLSHWFIPVHGLGFLAVRDHLYPLLIGIFLGVFTIALSYSIYHLRASVIPLYFIWLGLQAMVLFIFWAGWWRPEWFSPNVQLVLGMILLAWLLITPLLFKLKRFLGK